LSRPGGYYQSKWGDTGFHSLVLGGGAAHPADRDAGQTPPINRHGCFFTLRNSRSESLRWAFDLFKIMHADAMAVPEVTIDHLLVCHLNEAFLNGSIALATGMGIPLTRVHSHKLPSALGNTILKLSALQTHGSSDHGHRTLTEAETFDSGA
jgi:hypothetical protein